jgi:zinc transporter ZupT
MFRRAAVKLVVGLRLGAGISPTLNAFVLGVLSGISMPIACVLGVYMAPLSNRLTGGILAFGSGSLIFAVTVSIYGHALQELETGQMYRWEDMMTIVGGGFGALFFLWVASLLEGDKAAHAKGSAEAHLLHEATPIIEKDNDKAKVPRKSGTLAEVALHESSPGKKHHGDEEDTQMNKERFVAIALFFGLLIDGIPEGVFMGFMAAENQLSSSLVISLFIANFPEALSSAALLSKTGMKLTTIMAMWGGLCLLVGALTGISCGSILHFYPEYAYGARLPPFASAIVAIVDGFTGGAMLSCICSVMVPEAHHLVGKGGPLYCSSGFLSVMGFLSGVALEVSAYTAATGFPLLDQASRWRETYITPWWETYGLINVTSSM